MSKIKTILIMQSSSFPCYLVPLGPNIFLSTLFSNTLNLRPPSMCPMWETKFHAHIKTTDQIILLYILIFMFFDSKRKTKDCGPNGSRHARYQSAVNFFTNAIFICRVVPKYTNFATFPNFLLPTRTFMLWLCPEFCTRDTNTSSVFSGFTSRRFDKTFV
jgi:hypothetical protein